MIIRLTASRLAVAVGLGVLIVLSSSGCGGGGPEVARVSGKVTYKGQPVTKGRITFVASGQGKQNATGDIQPDGTYRLQTFEAGDGAMPGDYKVTIYSREEDAVPPQFVQAKPPAPKFLVPEKYENPDNSGLNASVKSGTNTFNFDLAD